MPGICALLLKYLPFEETDSMLPAIMDFRDTYCSWCDKRRGSVEECAPCPKYRKYLGGEDLVLDDQAFCSICTHNHSEEFQVYCSTNRRLQLGSGEPFECYKFCLNNTKTKK